MVKVEKRFGVKRNSVNKLVEKSYIFGVKIKYPQFYCFSGGITLIENLNSKVSKNCI